MNKNFLRKKYKDLRQKIAQEKQLDLSIKIANHFLKMDLWRYVYFHIFLTIRDKNEVDTGPLLNILWGRNKEVIVSRSDFSTSTLSHFLLTENTPIKSNSYGIPEPIEGIAVGANKIQVVIIPLLAYDRQGNRLGYGKGFYDRFLQKSKAVKIGVSFFEPEEKPIDTNEQDVPLDYCISPERIYTF